ncbi:ketopantoate reductase family protein [Sphaerochaeta sp. PS]|uniref:ketopantoate reductase family protein n=1 Tax=Sphaerochaeta sp. PS TaxID=3076336 RepID=UPI0028A3433B|nr:ketopantoate reductase family protein [Sphaerochaeta sp. PS]MDT4761111.1 ketopantoate reductase family protein [Sphaerochaeta sp. PS]
MRIAIYGAGSLGTILGAYLAKQGVDVDLITRNKAHVAALQANGAKVVGKVAFSVPVKALLPSEMQGTYDLIFLLTKQTENHSVALFLKDYLDPKGMLCTMQNGLPEPGLAEVLGKGRVAGCTIGWGSTLQGAGVAELTSEPDSLTFDLGMVEGYNQQALETIAEILRNMGIVTIDRNFLGARWSKLLINTAFSGMGTVVGGTYGDITANKEARALVQRIMKECIDTAKASGVTIEPVQGKDIVKLFDYSGPVKKWFAFHLIPIAMKKHRAIRPSMLQDIEKDKPCEVGAINGVLSQQARKVNVPTPINDRVIDIIARIEAKELRPEMANLKLFP